MSVTKVAQQPTVNANEIATKLADVTMRDIFAAFALAGIMARVGPDQGGISHSAARAAYHAADAMLEAREAGGAS